MMMNGIADWRIDVASHNGLYHGYLETRLQWLSEMFPYDEFVYCACFRPLPEYLGDGQPRMKIGMSRNNVTGRLRAQCFSISDLACVLNTTQCRHLEKALHARYKNMRLTRRLEVFYIDRHELLNDLSELSEVDGIPFKLITDIKHMEWLP